MNPELPVVLSSLFDNSLADADYPTLLKNQCISKYSVVLDHEVETMGLYNKCLNNDVHVKKKFKAVSEVN